MRRTIIVVAAWILAIGGFAMTAIAHEECVLTPAELLQTKVKAADAAYNAKVASANAAYRAAAKPKKNATLRDDLAALRAAKLARKATVEAAATERRTAYAEADALAPREPKTDEERYLVMLRDVGPKIEAEYRSKVQSLYRIFCTLGTAGRGEATKTAENARVRSFDDEQLEIQLIITKQLRTERYDALRYFYFEHRPQNQWDDNK